MMTNTRSHDYKDKNILKLDLFDSWKKKMILLLTAYTSFVFYYAMQSWRSKFTKPLTLRNPIENLQIFKITPHTGQKACPISKNNVPLEF